MRGREIMDDHHGSLTISLAKAMKKNHPTIAPQMKPPPKSKMSIIG
jgi:hypothetical protein